MRASYAKHRDQRVEESTVWRVANRELHRALVRDWQKRNYEAVLGHNGRRRARVAGGGGRHTVAQWLGLLEYFGHCCAYCNRHETECGSLTRDHIEPLIRGGTDDIGNIAPACRSCNFRKGPRTLLRFIQLGEGNCRSIVFR